MSTRIPYVYACNTSENRNQQQEQTRRETNVRVLIAELKACNSSRNLKRGKQLHAEAIKSGEASCVYVANTLVSMYAKCGSMVGAQQVFDGVKHPTVVSWNTLILGYAANGQGSDALENFRRMRSQGFTPDRLTFVAAVKACASLASEEANEECKARGREIHKLATDAGWDAELYVQNALVDMYSNCGAMDDACAVFNSILRPDVVSWNALIMGYAENGEGTMALSLFARMASQSCVPDSATVVAALKACTCLARLDKIECRERGRQVHSLAFHIGCCLNMYVQSALIDMYGRCGNTVDAQRVFNSITSPDVVSWNALILGYVENGEERTALDLFDKMGSQGCTPDSRTFVAAFKACSSLGQTTVPSGKAECRDRGKRIHLLAVDAGCHLDTYVQGTLIDMYANCGSMVDAQKVFERIKSPTAVSWNALMFGYAENGEAVTALNLLTTMRSRGLVPDSWTFVAALKACSLLGALEFGRKLHEEINMSNLNMFLVTCLVDFYAKCGSPTEAKKVFDSHFRLRDTKTWNALLSGYTHLGDTKAVFSLFKAMQGASFEPNGVTFLCVLTCCSHAGLVGEGKVCFETLCTKYQIHLSVEHYNCMLDIFGRSNKLDDAMTLLWGMHCGPNAVTWMTVLGACRKWKDVDFGRLAFESLVSLDPSKVAAYALMAQIYASRGLWKEREMVMRMRKKFASCKDPGQSWWVDEVGEVHAFFTGDPEIYAIREKVAAMVTMTRHTTSH